MKPTGIQLLATNEIQEIDLPKTGPAALGVVSSAHYTETADNALNKAMRADLVAMFGPNTTPDVATVGAYDGLHVIYQIVAKLGPRFNPDEAICVRIRQRFDQNAVHHTEHGRGRANSNR